MKSTKTTIKTANVPREMFTNIAIPVLQAAAIIGVGCSPLPHDWAFWLILSILIVMCLYFSFMLVYKLYRARLTFVTFTEKKISYYAGFCKVEIDAEKIAVTLCDYGKPDSKTKYAFIYDGEPDNGFLFAVSAVKSLNKFRDCVPEPLLRFIIACTQPSVLDTVKATASDRLKELIELDLREREKTRLKEQEQARKKRKKKK